MQAGDELTAIDRAPEGRVVDPSFDDFFLAEHDRLYQKSLGLLRLATRAPGRG